MHDTLVQPAAVRATPRARWQRLEWLIVLGIVVGAFGLRAWSVRSGLPYVAHPDEPNPVEYAARMLQTGDLNPHVFRKPSLYVYLLLGVFSIHYRWGLATGLYPEISQMMITTHLYTTVPEFFVWGRLLTALLGSLTALGAYVLGRWTWGRSAGLLAALFVATAPFHLFHSQFVTMDVPSGLVVLLAYLGAMAVLQTGSWRAYLLAGLCVGLSASTKYNAGVIAVAVAVAHVLHWERQLLRQALRPIVAALAAAAGFVLGTPYAVLAWPEFVRSLVGQVEDYDAGVHGDLTGAWDVGGYLHFFWDDGLRPAAVIATLVGVVVLLRYRPKAGLLWLSFAATYLVALLAQSSHFMRNLIPLLVLCALPIGVAGAAAIEWLGQRQPRYQAVVAVVVALLLFARPTQASIAHTTFYARPSSQVQADEYIRSLPRGQRIAVELEPAAWAGDPLIEAVPYLTAQPLDWYRAHGYRYLVGNELWRDTNDLQLYEALRSGATVRASFGGLGSGFSGPRIDVLDLGVQPEALALVRQSALFGTDLRLLGYELRPGPLRPMITSLEGADERVIRPGEPLQINLHWQALNRLPHDYALFVHVVDQQGNVVAQRDAVMRQAEYPTTRWQPDELVIDRADLPLPALPPGQYRLDIGVYRMENGERLSQTQPAPTTDGFTLTTIEVVE